MKSTFLSPRAPRGDGRVGRFLTEDKWCQGCFAKTAAGLGCSPMNDSAVRWCVMGAISLCYGSLDKDVMEALQYAVGKASVYYDAEGDIVNFNDNRTFEEVLEKVKEAGI